MQKIKAILVISCLFLVASLALGQTITQVTVSGKVTDPDGKPVMGVFVNLSDPVTHLGAGGQTDSTGTYKFSIAPGAYSADVSPQGDVPFLRIHRENVAVTAALTLDFKLERGVVLSGVVKDPDGKPLKGVFVNLFALPNLGYGEQTREDGRYYLVVGPGTYSLSLGAPQGTPFLSVQKEGLSLRTDTTLDFTLERGVFLSGKVTDPDGKPLKDTYVGVFNKEGAGGANTDADGNYRFPVRPGAYELSVNPPSGTSLLPEHRTGLEVKGDLTLNISLKKGATVSSVVRDPDGKRVQNVYVNLQDPKTSQGYGAATDADGAYSIVVTPGRYNLNASPPSGSPLLPFRKDGLDVAADLRLDLNLERGNILSGRVTDPDGKPVQNVYINLYSPQPGALGSGGNTDADGRYRIALLPGTYSISIGLPSGSPFVSKSIPDYKIAGDQTFDIKLDRGATLSGRVTDPDGKPVQGVNINAHSQLLNAGGGIQTDAEGRYRIILLPGTYSINISLPSGSALVSKNIQEYKITADQTLDIKLDRGNILSGRVTDPDGKPVQNVYVNLYSSQPGAIGAGGSTDAEGRYRITLLPGTYSVSISVPSGSPLVSKNIQDFKITADQTFDVKLDRGNILSGRVTDPDGKPVQNVYVNAYSSLPGALGSGGNTDADGRYRVTLLPGTYNVSIGLPSGSSFVSKNIQDYKIAGDQTLDIKLDRGSILSGRVTDPDGKPVQNVYVNVYSPQPGAFGNGGNTDEDGRYRVVLLPGTYSISIGLPSGSPFVSKSIPDYKIAGDQTFDIKLDRGVALSGRITDPDGRPVQNVNVNLWSQETQTGGGAQTDAEGRYRITLLPGTYSLNINPPQGSPLVSKSILSYQVPIDQTLDIKLDRGLVLSGRVTDPDGKPVQNVYINAWNQQAQIGSGGTTDAEGRYRVSLLPGTYSLNIGLPPGSPFVSKNIQSYPITANQTLDVKLESGKVLSGRVTGPDGKPVQNVNVSAYNPQAQTGGRIQTDAEGRYRIALVPGAYDVTVNPQSGSPLVSARAERTNVFADAVLDFKLERGSTLSGRILGPDGQPVPEVNVNAYDPRTSANSGARTGPDGKYALVLKNGDYDLNVNPPPASLFVSRRLSDVKVGGDQTLDIKLERGVLLSGHVTGPDAKPAQNVYVNAWNPQAQTGGGAQTDADGGYRITLTPGVYSVNLGPPPGTAFAGQYLENLEIFKDRVLDAKLEKGFVLSGTVQDKLGRPVSNASVNAYSSQINFGGGGVTGPDGHYRIVLKLGVYEVAVNPDPTSGLTRTAFPGVDMKADRTLDVVLQSGVTLSGKVVGPKGGGVEGVSISAQDEDLQNGPEGSATTDRDGVYSMILPPGLYRLDLRPADGTRFLQTQVHDVSLKTDRQGFDIRLDEGVVLSGRVTDPDGKPIRDAYVNLYDPAAQFWYGDSADPDGVYRVVLKQGVYTLHAEPPHVQGTVSSLVSRNLPDVRVADDMTLNLALDRGVFLSGRVTDRAGRPLPEVNINASSNQAFGGGTQTDLDGKYRLALRPDVYFIYVSPRPNTAYVPQRAEQVEMKGERTLDFTLDEGIVLSGRVTDAEGTPLNEAHIRAGDRDKSDGDEGYATTGRDGTYRLPLPAGVYDVTVEPPDGSGLLQATAASVDLTAPRALDFKLKEGLLLSGLVKGPDGQGLFNARISVNQSQTGEWHGTQTRRDGTYLLALPPGTYGLRAEPPQGRGLVMKELKAFEFKERRKLDITFDRGITLSGKITDPDGKPMVDAGVNAWVASGEVFWAGSQSDGTYLLALPPGTYSLSVYPRSGSNLLPRQIQAVEIQADRKLDIALERGVTLSGRVTDGKGNSVQQVNVHAEDGQGAGNGVPVDRDGRYSLPLKPGTYTVTFDPFGGRLIRRVMEKIEVRDSRTLDVTLADGAAVSGRVTDASGKEVADVSVNAFAGQELRYVSGARTFFDGTYSLALPPGTYTLAFDPAPGTPYVRQALKDVKVDGDRKQDVVLSAGLVLSGRVTGPTGAGIPQAGLTIRNADTGDAYGAGTDQDGNYRQTLPPGTYIINVGPPPTSRLGFKEIKDVRVVANKTLDIALDAQVGISGRVLDPDGKTVPFARISAEAPGLSRGSGSDDRGLYTLPLPPGTYAITVYPPVGSKLRRTRVENVSVTSDQTLDLKLERGIGLSGKVADATGKGLEKVSVSLFNTTTKEWTGTSTASDGTYGIGLEAGTYELTVISFDPASRFIQRRLTGVEIKTDRTLDIVLDQGFLVTGRVTDGGGNGIPRVGVNAVDATGAAFGRGTDDKGAYSLTLPAGTYRIEAYPPQGAGLIPRRLADVNVSADLKLDIPLEKGVTLKGRVTDASGAAVERVGVSAFNPSTGENYGGGTGIEGTYAVALPPGTYRVAFYPPEGRGLTRKEIPDVALSADRQLDVTLERGLVLSGRILTPAGDRGVADVEMFFILKGKGPVAEALTSTDGFYRAALPPGTYTIGYTPPAAKGYLPALVEGVQIDQNRTLDFKLEEGTALLGRVAGPGNTPVSGAILTAVNKKGEKFSSITSSDGLFRMILTPGVYDLEVQPSAGSGLASQKIPSVDTAAGKPLDIRLIPAIGPAVAVGTVKVTPSAATLPADGASSVVLSVTVTRPDGSPAAADDSTSVALLVDGPAAVKPGTVRVKGGVGSALLVPTTVAGKIEVVAAAAGLAAGKATLTSFPATGDAETTALTVGPVVTDITATAAAVLWGTDRPSDGVVEYGLTPAFGATQPDTGKTARHRVLLNDLKPSTIYRYRVVSGGTRSRTLSFTTGAPASENSGGAMEMDLDPAPGNQKSASRAGLKAGQTVEVAVYAKGIRNVAGFVLDLDFDPATTPFVSAASASDAEKNLLATGGGNAVFLAPPVKGGSLRFGGSILAPTAGTVASGDGLLGRFTFKMADDFGAGREAKVTLAQTVLRGLVSSQQDTLRALTTVVLSSGGTSGGGSGPVVIDLDLAPGDQGKRTLSGLQSGAAFDVEVAATANATGATGFTARIEFDPKKLTYVGFNMGSLIPDIKGLPNPGDGVVEVGGSILGSGAGAVKDSGTLATVRFQVSGDLIGAASLTLTSASLRKGGQQERFTPRISVEVQASAVTGKPSADFDGDGEVGFNDFFLFANAFGFKKGDKAFDGKLDLDQNGEVEFNDFFLFANEFGKVLKAGKRAR